jgi:hypothetical protein
MDGHEPGQTPQEAKDGLSPRTLWLAWLLVAIGVCWCWYATWYEDGGERVSIPCIGWSCR